MNNILTLGIGLVLGSLISIGIFILNDDLQIQEEFTNNERRMAGILYNQLAIANADFKEAKLGVGNTELIRTEVGEFENNFEYYPKEKEINIGSQMPPEWYWSDKKIKTGLLKDFGVLSVQEGIIIWEMFALEIELNNKTESYTIPWRAVIPRIDEIPYNAEIEFVLQTLNRVNKGELTRSQEHLTSIFYDGKEYRVVLPSHIKISEEKT